jgi:hypothetical protein
MWMAPSSAQVASVVLLQSEDEVMNRESIHVTQHTGVGFFWLGGWLFTIGYSGLSFWWGVLALFIWPYFLGVDIASQGVETGGE